MLTELGQLIYTSFPGVGLKELFSSQVPKEIQKVFLHQIVYRNWNSYKPPSSGEQAIYLYQPNLESCIFGWLYSDSFDEHGRHIPYFLAYFLEASLNTDSLQQIITCLQRGPISFQDYDPNSSQPPEPINIEEIQTYKPAREGLLLSTELSSSSHIALKEGQTLDVFMFSDQSLSNGLISVANRHDQPIEDSNNSYEEKSSSQEQKESLTNASDSIAEILQELMKKPLEIKSAFLVSSEGQLITPPINMDEDSALIIAGTMIYLAKGTSTELHWQQIEKIFIQGKEGYVILACCTSESFLLIQAGKTLMGLLDGEVNRTIQKIRTVLPHDETALDSSKEQLIINELSKLNNKSNEDAVLYRGNPIKKPF